MPETVSEKFFHEATSKVYTPISLAHAELMRRRKDKVLMKKVADFIGTFPIADTSYPRAFLSRPVTTPNFEMRTFLTQAEMIGLDPVSLEYPGKLVAKNADKYHACNMYFRKPGSKLHSHQVSKIKVADISKFEGKPMATTPTIFNETLPDFHRRLFLAEFPLLKDSIIDYTVWFNKNRHATEHYYLYHLALFICNGILFDNFFFNDIAERDFIIQKILPSFDKVTEMFGVQPLIVPILPLDSERSHEWLYYPETTRESIRLLYGV